MIDQKINIYEPGNRLKIGLFKTCFIMLRNIATSKELIFQLFKRDFFMVYKKSFVGMSWIFISPIVGIISWVFMNSTGILTPGSVEIPYPAYVLLSSSIWGLFMSFYQSTKGTLSVGAGFIMQVKYPHEALLIKQALMAFANFIITFMVNIIVLLALGVYPNWLIFLLPFLILPLFFLGSTIGLLMSVLSVVSPDFNKGFNVLFNLTIYITPVIYSPKTTNKNLELIIKYNPLTYLICFIRDIILYGKSEYLKGYLLISLISLLVFMIAWKIFYVSEDMVIEKMI